MPDPHFSDLILPNAENPSLSSLLSSLKRTTLSIPNRLVSIRADAEFVSRVAKAYGGRRPLVANERCGSWYIPPEEKAAGAYFKSTDGHERAWKFSTRRLNLHLLDLAEKNDGIIIVDSTRRGKRMPDALSTTLPIWCTIINQALLPSHPSSSRLFLPPSHSPSTHAQITALLPSFLASLQSLNLDLSESLLTKPLRPLWVTPDSTLPDSEDGDGDGDEDGDGDDGTIFEDFRPIICCTASRRVVGSEMDQGGYVQGAGDDTENWAHGLTPPVFWKHIDELLSTPEADLVGLITRLVEEDKAGRALEGPRTQLTPRVSVCPLPLPPPSPSDNECRITLMANVAPKEEWVKSPTHLEAGLGKSKIASRNLRTGLAEICAFASNFFASSASDAADTQPQGRVIIACESGKDLSVGVALALLCYLFDERGNFRIPGQDATFTKTLIKARLGSIMTTYPEANPSRSTLQSVNSFLMDWQR